jgi:pimeloyl-ACP methyl ester carboxylesterase
MIKKSGNLEDSKGRKIYYDIIGDGQDAIIFAGGLMSDKEGSKAITFEKFAIEAKRSYIRFDYLGHGISDAKFQETNINDWRDNLFLIIDKLTTGKITLIGSSLGGWLVLLAALRRKERVKKIITIAAAPDFTEDLLWDDFSSKIKKQLEVGEIYNLPSDYCDGEYPISMQLIESGRENFLLRGGKININIPVRLLHGMEDKDVPYQYSQKIADKLTSNDVEVELIKSGDHRMSEPEILKQIWQKL